MNRVVGRGPVGQRTDEEVGAEHDGVMRGWTRFLLLTMSTAVIYLFVAGCLIRTLGGAFGDAMILRNLR